MNLQPHYIGDEEPSKKDLVVAEAVPDSPMIIEDDVVVIDGRPHLVIEDDSSAIAPVTRTPSKEPTIRIDDDGDVPTLEISDTSDAAPESNLLPVTSADRMMAGVGGMVGVGGGFIGGMLAHASNGVYGADWTGMIVATGLSFFAGTIAALLSNNFVTKWWHQRRGSKNGTPQLPADFKETMSFAGSTLTDWSTMLLFAVFLVVAVGVAWTSTKLLSAVLTALVVAAVIPGLAWGLGILLFEHPSSEPVTATKAEPDSQASTNDSV